MCKRADKQQKGCPGISPCRPAGTTDRCALTLEFENMNQVISQWSFVDNPKIRNVCSSHGMKHQDPCRSANRLRSAAWSIALAATIATGHSPNAKHS